MMCFSFGGWVGQNWMGIGQKYPEITLSTLDLFLKRDVCIIYIYIYLDLQKHTLFCAFKFVLVIMKSVRLTIFCSSRIVTNKGACRHF